MPRRPTTESRQSTKGKQHEDGRLWNLLRFGVKEIVHHRNIIKSEFRDVGDFDIHEDQAKGAHRGGGLGAWNEELTSVIELPTAANKRCARNVWKSLGKPNKMWLAIMLAGACRNKPKRVNTPSELQGMHNL